MFTIPNAKKLSLPLWILFLSAFCFLPLSAKAQTTVTYTVRSGDYLMSIARRYGISLTEINQANNLKTDIIVPGQKLVIPRALLSLKGDDVRFARPCRKQGKVLRSFGNYKEDGLLLPHAGIEFVVPHGTLLTSCSHGVIRHIGSMPGLGTLVIIDHGGGYHTVMGPFADDSLEITTGDAVVQGQTLGQVARAHQGKSTFAHIELRKDTIAINPATLLE
jgi:LysM repeat protein